MFGVTVMKNIYPSKIHETRNQYLILPSYSKTLIVLKVRVIHVYFIFGNLNVRTNTVDKLITYPTKS